MPITTTLPSDPQWRLLNLLAIRALFAATRQAGDVLNRTDARPSDLGELAEMGWIHGTYEDGGEVDLVNDWNHSLRLVHLRLTGAGHAWTQTDPHNTLLFECATGIGPRRLSAKQVAALDEVIAALSARQLLLVESENGDSLKDGPLPPSRQFPHQALLLRLTRRGERIVNP